MSSERETSFPIFTLVLPLCLDRGYAHPGEVCTAKARPTYEMRIDKVVAMREFEIEGVITRGRSWGKPTLSQIDEHGCFLAPDRSCIVTSGEDVVILCTYRGASTFRGCGIAGAIGIVVFPNEYSEGVLLSSRPSARLT